MRYEEYKVEDFLFDEFFVRWVRNPGPETEHFWKSWIEKNPDKLEALKRAREIVQSIEYKNQQKPTKKEYNEVLENILKQKPSFTQIGYSKKSDRLTYLARIAAVLLILISFSAIFFSLNKENIPEKIVVKSIEKQNPNGVKTTFELDDGTIVRLNAGSKLVYPEVFSTDTREVWLEGEAFFSVVRDEDRPFFVRTKDLTTTVLGTSFNINSYAEQRQTSVAVESGKVRVVETNKEEGSENRIYLLIENQMLTYTSVDNQIVKTENISSDIFSWKDNIIHFKHTSFQQVISCLQRWYGVKFVVERNKSFSGQFTGVYNDQPLELLLEGLKDQYDFEYELKGKTVYIK